MGKRSLSQLGLTAFLQAAPVVVVVTAAALLLARRFDILALGDDTASSLGVPIRSTRAIGILLAVTLTRGVGDARGADGLRRAVRACARPPADAGGAESEPPPAPDPGGRSSRRDRRDPLGCSAAGDHRGRGGDPHPDGVATTLLGAIVLVLMARRLRDAGPTREPPRVRFGVRSRLRFRITMVVVVLGVIGVLLLGLLAGPHWLLTGDIVLWLQGEAPPAIAFALDERAPRIAAAVVAGGALALSGAIIQGVSRNRSPTRASSASRAAAASARCW